MISLSPEPCHPLEPRRPMNLEMTFQKKNVFTEKVKCRFSFFSQGLNSKQSNLNVYPQKSQNSFFQKPNIQSLDVVPQDDVI